jgi:hypothetical protein
MSRRAELALLAAGLVCLVLFAALPLAYPDPQSLPGNYLSTLRYAAGALYGASATDLAQDVIGMRALVAGENPYTTLGPALQSLGLDWDLDFSSPHPPTAFLLVAPVAFLPWAQASAIWALLMIICWTASLRLLGANGRSAIGLGGLLLLWPPAATSLGQLTALWLLFLVQAYVWRQRRPAAAGIVVGLASMTKLSPALALLPFAVSRRGRHALAGFVLAWAAALSIVLALRPTTLADYWTANQTGVIGLIEQAANGAPVTIAWRLASVLGVLAWLLFLGAILWRNRAALVAGRPSAWMLGFYLAVAALPLLWIYSLLPLLPVAGHSLLRRGAWGRVATLAALALSFVAPAFGPASAPYVGGAVLLFGASLLAPEQD